jgi:hypothetical protein
MTLVNAASLMAKNNWPSPNTFNASQLGSWKNTVGVYDQQLVNLAASYGDTPEQYVEQTGTADAVAEQYTAAETAATTTPSIMSFLTSETIIPGIPNALLFGLGAGAIVLLTTKK